MSSFTNPLSVTKILKGQKSHWLFFKKNVWAWKLEVGFRYYVGGENSNEYIVVPAGLESDGATLPKFLWPIIGHPMDEYAQAAFLHDHIAKNLRDRYSRKRGEEIMYEAMGVLGVSTIKRRIMYRGLRAFGWYLWNRGDK